MREAGTGLKTAWRGQITQAGLGWRLANSIRSQTYPRTGESLRAAALVWSKALVIVGAHDTGPLIRSKDGFWLATPTPAAGRGLRGGKITPGEWERRRGLRLRFVYRRRGPSLLVADGRLRNWASRSVVRRWDGNFAPWDSPGSPPARSTTHRTTRPSRRSKNFCDVVDDIRTQCGGKPTGVRFQDEVRIGQKNKLTRRWARRTISGPNGHISSGPSALPGARAPGWSCPVATLTPWLGIASSSVNRSMPGHTPS